MSPETQAALEGVDVAKGAAKVASILANGLDETAQRILVGVNTRPANNPEPVVVSATFSKPKKPRKDKGIPRPKPTAAAPASGKITEAQAAHLDRLAITVRNKRIEATKASLEALDAESAWYAYLTEITAK